jgi:hypothetical protein
MLLEALTDRGVHCRRSTVSALLAWQRYTNTCESVHLGNCFNPWRADASRAIAVKGSNTRFRISQTVAGASAAKEPCASGLIEEIHSCHDRSTVK